MSSYNIIDRRKNPSGKNLPNRQRFIERAKHKIRERIKDTFNKRSITDDANEQITIDGIDEPNFNYDTSSGHWHHVLPGNKKYIPGDTIPKPIHNPSGGGSKAGKGEGEDNFVFELNKDEYLNILFEDLELPDLVKRNEKNIVSWQRRRSGTSKSGSISNLDLVKSLKNSLARRIALAFPIERKIKELEELLLTIEDEKQKKDILQEISELKIRRLSIAYIDPLDIRYKRYERIPISNNQAVMFCVMDVSGSMSESQKEIAKRFFLLLYLFLQRKYNKVDIVFIRHTDSAKEVTEEEFFYGTESGGTEISTGLSLMKQIITDRYNTAVWNLYCVQATDGDNISSDNDMMMNLMNELLSDFQYYVYSEITPTNSGSGYTVGATVLDMLGLLTTHHKNLKLIKLNNVTDVVPTFRETFGKHIEK